MQASPTLEKIDEALKSLKENNFSPKSADASKKFLLSAVAGLKKCAILAGSAFETYAAKLLSKAKKIKGKSFDTAFKIVSQSKASLIAAGF